VFGVAGELKYSGIDDGGLKARKVSITAIAPLAFLARFKGLWIEIFIVAAWAGSFERSVRARLARAFGDVRKQKCRVREGSGNTIGEPF
jgi:hypothetical protein